MFPPRRAARLFLGTSIFITLTAVAGCGQKGPLFLPPAAGTATVTAIDDTTAREAAEDEADDATTAD